MITDGQRIAELLAGELTGLAVGPLATVTVVDAESDVEPTEAGAFAYAIEHAGERVGEVDVRPSAAVVTLDRGWSDGASDADGLRAGSPHELVVERGAAVKAASDALREALAE